MNRGHVVLIHGAWAGSWVWDTLLEPLLNSGYEPHPLDLPGVGSWPDGARTDLDDVADVVVAHIDSLDGPVFVVGHSGGGIVATQVAERLPHRISGMAYVAGMMLPSGSTFGDLCGDLGLPEPVGISAWLESTPDGSGTVVPPEAAAAVFFHESSAGAAIAAARKLLPQLETARLMAPAWTPERFGSVPRLYVEATLDRSVPLVTQRAMQARVPGAQVVTLDSDHAPQLSARAALLTALVDFCASVGPRTVSAQEI
ncbi:alpha/beta fold hydrolase [Rhodococcus jostii]|uniref:alpha/beta fold hydrolase n=1 Tax=Rhodococcus jostii TaxID=132919 RepID=UPI003658E58B